MTTQPRIRECTDPLSPDRSTPASLWRNRDYLSWWGGTAFSQLGSNVSVVAFPLLVVFTTGSITGASVIAAAGRIGSLLTMMWGGALADRISRRLLLTSVPVAQAVLMGVVAWSVGAGEVNISLLAGAGLVDGLLVGVVSGATMPALRRIVPREQFAARAAQQQGVQQATQLVGSPLAAFLFSVSRWLPFGLDAVSFLLASAGSALIQHPLGPDQPVSSTLPPDGTSGDRVGKRSTIADIGAGWRVVRMHPFLRYTYSWVAVTNMVGNSVVLLLIARLKEQGLQPRAIGFTNAAVLSGGIVGAVLCAGILRALGARRVFMTGGWIYVASLGVAALAGRPWQTTVAVCVFVFASVPTASVWEAYTVSLVPDRLTGRVGSVSNFSAQSLTWVGLLLAGVLADGFGASIAMLCFAGILIPFAVANHLCEALVLLQTPVERVREIA
jgi:MFS family permease